MQMRMTASAREKLLDAALGTIRARGYAATSVDALCARAGVTKGAFFHHFDGKEALAVAAAEHWSETTGQLFASAAYHGAADPLDRVLAYIDFRKDLIDGAIAEFTCLAGTMAQETFDTAPAIRDACWRSIAGHAKTLEADIDAALRKYKVRAVNARSLALYTQATLQGAFILAKASNDPQVAIDCVDHLKRYVMLLFGNKE